MTGAVRPQVVVAADPGSAPTALREVRAGLEEEGVPHRLLTRPGGAAALAALAAGASELAVGLGLDADEVVVTHARLPPGAPLLRVPVAAGPLALRTAGQDAARLVTTRPLAGLPGSRGAPYGPSPV